MNEEEPKMRAYPDTTREQIEGLADLLAKGWEPPKPKPVDPKKQLTLFALQLLVCILVPALSAKGMQLFTIYISYELFEPLSWSACLAVLYLHDFGTARLAGKLSAEIRRAQERRTGPNTVFDPTASAKQQIIKLLIVCLSVWVGFGLAFITKTLFS